MCMCAREWGLGRGYVCLWARVEGVVVEFWYF